MQDAQISITSLLASVDEEETELLHLGLLPCSLSVERGCSPFRTRVLVDMIHVLQDLLTNSQNRLTPKLNAGGEVAKCVGDITATMGKVLTWLPLSNRNREK